MMRATQRQQTPKAALKSDASASGAKGLSLPVTLIVYGWRENAPGTLAWVFPSFSAARAAVRAFRNAARWLIVAGRRAEDDVDVERVRRDGLVLMECFA